MNLLDQPLAVLVSVIVAVTLWVMYFKLEPWTKRTKSFYFQNIFPLMFHAVMLSLALSLIVSTTWKNDLWHNLFMTRVNDLPTSAHVLSYLTIPVFYGLAFWKWRDAWRSLLATALMIWTHEGIWFIFYYLSSPQSIASFADLSFFILISNFALIYSRKYAYWNEAVPFWVPIGLQIVYDFDWYRQGFPITVTNNPFQPTIWADDLLVNAIEVCSWLLLLATMIVWLRLNTANHETLAKEEQRE